MLLEVPEVAPVVLELLLELLWLYGGSLQCPKGVDRAQRGVAR